MAERPVLVGLIPQTVVIDPNDQVSWISDAGSLRVEFDVNRCPFSSNIFQAPAGIRLLSGPPPEKQRRRISSMSLKLAELASGCG